MMSQVWNISFVNRIKTSESFVPSTLAKETAVNTYKITPISRVKCKLLRHFRRGTLCVYTPRRPRSSISQSFSF